MAGIRRFRGALFAAWVLGFGFILTEAGARGAAFLCESYRRSRPASADFTVYVVGESTAFGEPFAPEVSFPSLVSRMLGGEIDGKPIQIVNLAETGSNTEAQYWKLLAELVLRPKPDGVLLIYAGINEAFAQPAPGFLKKLAGYSLCLSRLSYLIGDRFGAWPPMDYAYRMRRLIELGQGRGLPVVVSTLVGNVREFGPSIERVARSAGLYEAYLSARALERKGDLSGAAAIYEPLAEGDAGARHRLAGCYYQLGRYAQARKLYWQVIDYGGSKRPTGEQNQIIRALAREKGAVLADSLALFERDSPQGLPGYNLFVDAHHPNLRGCALLAQGFASALSKSLRVPLARGRFTERELERDFSVDARKYAAVYASRVIWFCAESRQRREKTDALAMAAQYLVLAEKKLGQEIAALRFFIALAGGERKEVLHWLKRKDALYGDRYGLSLIAHNKEDDLRLLREIGLPREQEKIGEELLAHAHSLFSASSSRAPRSDERSKVYAASKPLVDAGVALAGAGDWKGAHAKFSRGAAIDPDNAEAHLSLCVWHLNQGRLADAAQACARAAAGAGKFPERYAPGYLQECRRVQALVEKKIKAAER